MTRSPFLAWLLVILVMMPMHARAISIEADMGANILDLKSLSYEEAKEFCESEPQLIQCDIFNDKLEQKTLGADNRVISIATYSYPVLSTNLE